MRHAKDFPCKKFEPIESHVAIFFPAIEYFYEAWLTVSSCNPSFLPKNNTGNMRVDCIKCCRELNFQTSVHDCFSNLFCILSWYPVIRTVFSSSTSSHCDERCKNTNYNYYVKTDTNVIRNHVLVRNAMKLS